MKSTKTTSAALLHLKRWNSWYRIYISIDNWFEKFGQGMTTNFERKKLKYNLLRIREVIGWAIIWNFNLKEEKADLHKGCKKIDLNSKSKKTGQKNMSAGV